MHINNPLLSNDELTNFIKDHGIITWEELTKYIADLPYGRNSNRIDLELVIKEQKGTCSSKHAFLKHIANLNNITNIKLILGIYKMNHINTPKIGDELIKNDIDYIPEAHCYLKIDGHRKDFTSSSSNFENIKNDVLEEIEIQPEQVSDFKINYHKNYINQWVKQHNLMFNFEQVWLIREKCITNLTE